MTQNENTVAYPGREGAHSAAACDRLFPAARLIPQASFDAVVEAVTARSLSCALARLLECGRYPDVIVSDYRLGAGASGVDAIRRIRHELGMAIPAMIITGDTAPKSLRVIQASGYCYLPKPVTAERLRVELSKLLETAREVVRPAAIED